MSVLSRQALNDFCKAMPAAEHVVQWGNSDVWKVGGKVFAVIGWHESDAAITFKVTPLAFEVLGDQPGIRPAPYLASRGMKWLQVYAADALSQESLHDHITASYDMAVQKLTKKRRAELGLGA